jgi:hypothetical protein
MFASGLGMDEIGILKIGSLTIISIVQDKIIPGYWSNIKLNRIVGIDWDNINRFLSRNFNYDLSEWNNYKYQGKIRIGKINNLNIWTMNPLDENKWVLDIINRNIQYICNHGNIIQLDLPKKGKLI